MDHEIFPIGSERRRPSNWRRGLDAVLRSVLVALGPKVAAETA
ncbi:hypothetical protein [Amycolatopsis sp. NPDC051061]